MPINKKQISGFLDNYRLGKLLGYKKIKSGFANRIVKIKTDQGDYILKIAIRNNPHRVKYEIDLLNFLSGLPVPKPIKAKNGAYLLNYGANKAFIYKFIEGEQIFSFSADILKQVGELLARFHLKSARFKSDIKRFELYTVESEFEEMVGQSRQVNNLVVQNNIDYVVENLPNFFLPSSLPQGAIHSDFKPENTIFLNNKISGLVDFDNSYRGLLILDLAITMMWFCSRGKFNVEKAFIIFRAYNRVRKLTKAEKDYLFEAVHYAHISVALIVFYTYAANHKGFTNKERGWYVTDVNKYKTIMSWIIDNFLEAEKSFTLTKKEFKEMFGILS